MDVIADRTMEIEAPDGAEKKTIRVLLGKPEPNGAGDDWFVPYEIHGPAAGEQIRRLAFGVDALQALGAAIDILAVELKSLEHHGRLMLHGCPGIWILPGEAEAE